MAADLDEEDGGGRLGRLVAAEVEHDEREDVADEPERAQRAADDRVQDEVEQRAVGRQTPADLAVRAVDGREPGARGQHQRLVEAARTTRHRRRSSVRAVCSHNRTPNEL